MHILSLNDTKFEPDYGGAKCPKFNIVGNEEIDNLELAKLVGNVMGKEPNYSLMDYNKSRPGHDLRYSLSGDYMRTLGWEPKIKLRDRIEEVVHWTLEHNHWLLA
jgi:dTDP-glucose 4,6-dehydratase